MTALQGRGVAATDLQGRSFSGAVAAADLQGRSFSCAVTGTQFICHHEGALAPEGPALLTGGTHETL